MISDYQVSNEIEAIEFDLEKYKDIQNKLSDSEIPREHRRDYNDYKDILYQKIIVSISSCIEQQIKASHKEMLGNSEDEYITNYIFKQYSDRHVPFTNNINEINKNYIYIEGNFFFFVLDPNVKSSIAEIIGARHEISHTGKLKCNITLNHIEGSIIFLKLFKFQIQLNRKDRKLFKQLSLLHSQLKKNTEIKMAKKNVRKISKILNEYDDTNIVLGACSFYQSMSNYDLRSQKTLAINEYKKYF